MMDSDLSTSTCNLSRSSANALRLPQSLPQGFPKPCCTSLHHNWWLWAKSTASNISFSIAAWFKEAKHDADETLFPSEARPEGQCAGEESSRMHPSESSQCSTQTQCKWCHGLITHNPKPVRGCMGCSRASSPWHMGPCTFCCPLSPSLVLANTSQNQPSTSSLCRRGQEKTRMQKL